MAELILTRFGEIDSATGRRALVKRLRAAALSILPKGGPHGEVGPINHGRFKMELRDAEATVGADGAMFELHDLSFPTISLVHELAKAGGLAIVDSWGPSGTILFDRAQLETLPPDFRRPKPAVCTSARHLARMLGVSPKKVPAPAKLHKKYQWSKVHHDRSKGRLPGLHVNPAERYVYVQAELAEDDTTVMKRLAAFIRARKKLKTLIEPDGGGIWSEGEYWQVRLPTGDVFIPLSVTGYSCRPNSDHLIPVNIEAWLAIARDFARQSNRKTATIVNGKTLVLDTGRRYPLTRVESRRAPGR